ncbi:MAG TPA: FixH family protein [Aliidongia sp.]|nr:FixH family protein [Aliidongia sp.]
MTSESNWRFFPAAVAAGLLTVAAVNAGMIWSALASFPGAVDDHAFETGNRYNAVLDAAARQAALGWHLDLSVRERGLEAALAGPDGKPLPGLELHAIASRPVGPAETTNLDFAWQGDRYVATVPLPAPGRWVIEATADSGDVSYRATRRVLVQ